MPKPSTTASGCPRCGAERLKGAHGLLDSLFGPITGRRRYRCAHCSWSGWKRRLARKSTRDTSLLPKSGPPREAYWFLALTIAVLLVIVGLIVRSDSQSGLREPRPIELP